MEAQEIFDILATCCTDVDHAVRVTNMILQASQKEAFAPAAAPPVSTAMGQLLSLIPSVASSASLAGGTLLKGVDTVGNVAKNVGPLALAATIGPGYLTGHLLAKAMDVDSQDVNEIQEQELIDELRANAEQARKQRALREAE